MLIKNGAVIFLILVLLSVLTGVTPADTSKDPIITNTSDPVNVSAEGFDSIDNFPNSSMGTGVIRWYDKTTVSGKIKNFFKDFKYKSGFNL